MKEKKNIVNQAMPMGENPNKDRLVYSSRHEGKILYEFLETTEKGMSPEGIEEARERYGRNIVTHGTREPLFKRLFHAFINPFTAILLLLAIVSSFTDIILASSEDRNPTTVIIITTMVMISGILKFIQETRSGNAAAKLSAMIHTTTCVERIGKGSREIPIEDVVVGDFIHLSAGDMIPADVRIIYAKDLFISQSALTGESEPVEKISSFMDESTELLERNNLAFMGTNVISGTAKAVVVVTGDDTYLGEISKVLSEKPEKTSFEKGVNSVSWVLIRFMLVMVPIVLFINGFTKGDWMDATLFAISIAVGLTPEMLPMIVTTALAKGAVSLSKEKVIIKNLNAIQNLGAMDVLCTDKTGTLTQDKVVLEYPLDIHGNEDLRVLRHGFLNSYYQTGLKNLMDLAIIRRTHEEQERDDALKSIEAHYEKLDEIPFDFERRRMSVVVEDKKGKRQMITKGAVEEMLKVSSFVEYKGEVSPLTDEKKAMILKQVDDLNEDGLRVIAVAQKTNPAPIGVFSVDDEKDMVLIGYLAFLDPPKESTAKALKALKDHGVNVKILTGDNEKVTRCICKQVALPVNRILLGQDVDLLNDSELQKAAEDTPIFAKLSPTQKARIVRVLKENKHCVGFLGDGINDALAMKASDVGISVDTAVDIAKESADVILLEKSLMVLEKGLVEGRKTYGNMIKYIKMTASSNFGNMFSVLIASAFLPFLPMTSIQILLLNLIYDISCTALPWDNVDKEYLQKPRKWEASSIGKFMLWIGPTSSVFDIITFVLMYFVICPMFTGGILFHHLSDPNLQLIYIGVFQAGWFVESMWSQTLVIHMIRTPKIPFIQSRASLSLSLLTLAGILVLTVIPFTGVGVAVGLQPLPGVYFIWLIFIILLYMILATFVKRIYVRRYGELL